MIHSLPLEFPIYFKEPDNTPQAKRLKERLERIEGFKQRLEFFNKHIVSLSCFSLAQAVKYEWGNGNKIRVYSGCQRSDTREIYTPGEHEIFYRLREREVKRIVAGVNKANTYKAKLKFLLSVKGYYLHTPLEVYGNVPYDPERDMETAILDQGPLIDLNPADRAERQVFNELTKAENATVIRDQKGFTSYYTGFNFEKQVKLLGQSLAKAIDGKTLINIHKAAIERHFGYPPALQPESENETYVSRFNQEQTGESGFRNGLFLKVVTGQEIDFSRYKLTRGDWTYYTHISEIARYYEYLIQLLKKPLPSRRGANAGTDLKTVGKLYSHRQIAIAFFFTKEELSKETAAGILKKYSSNKSVPKLLAKRLTSAQELSRLRENKTSDTRHLNDLNAAKRLITGKKNKKALSDITRVITAFENSYKSRY